MTYDLKKVEKKFHEYLKTGLKSEEYNFDEIKITENLLEQEEAFYIPFGHISYFLVIEDNENPVVYTNVSSRMDLDLIVFIDENGYEDYDVWAGDHPDVSEKYDIQAKKVKRVNYQKDLKFISDVER